MNWFHLRRLSLWVVVCCVLVSSVFSQPPEKQEPDQKLEHAIFARVKSHQGDVAVAIEHLETGEFFHTESNRPMPTASLIKFPLLVATYHAAEKGEVDLEERIELTEEDKVPGSGLLTKHFSSGATLSLRDYVRLMIRQSDNTATNIVIEQVGLPVTAELMESLGCANTKLHSKVYRRDTSIYPERSRQFGLGSTTAAEMVRLLGLLHRGKLGSTEATDEMTEHLLACDDSSKLARFLSNDVKIAHKTGAIANCRTDAGIIYTQSGPVAVCVLTNKNEDQSWSDDNAATALCAAIGKAIVDRFGGRSEQLPMQQGAFGKMVETLQRTLNARLEPSSDLSIDGDFGPATRSAVERFQRQHSLDATGIVGPRTWKALGTLIERDEPVPSPEVIRNQILPKEARRPLSDPPSVTCKSWVIGDSNGNILWESNSTTPLEAASTTKIMTAQVVLQLADAQPEILDEVVTFSQRADNTVGSTSGLRAGENVTVGDLLYGLLLPSGNDASVALAQQFGSRLASKDTSDSAYDSFIRAMNATADKFGMTDTHYTNPHGLSDPEHLISARDLLRLGAEAMKNDLFRQIVRTRQFGCRIESNEGYARNVLWKNTNRLLKTEGYTGIKTGTTGAAGSCLVSCAQHESDELVVVVLGSSSSDGRYADTQNLFRWAWQQTRRPVAKKSSD